MALQFVIIQSDGLIAVDNCAISPLSLTGLAANIGQVSYQKTDGKLQYNDRPPTPVEFTDPAPYQPYLNTWITAAAALVPALQLAQAKQVKIDLIDGIFNHKRRVPFTQGAWQYDASDESVSNLDLLVQATAVVSSDASGLVLSINTAFSSLVNGINGTIVPGVNAMVNANNYSAGQVNSWSAAHDANFARVQLYSASPPANPGQYVMMSPTADPWVSGGLGSGGFQSMAGVGGVSGVSVSGSAVPGFNHVGNITHQPLNATTPQSIPAGDISLALQGIANRRNTLNSNRMAKKIAVNALTTIPAVVAYDATTGWSF